MMLFALSVITSAQRPTSPQRTGLQYCLFLEENLGQLGNAKRRVF